jgi:hypothetical protein
VSCIALVDRSTLFLLYSILPFYIDHLIFAQETTGDIVKVLRICTQSLEQHINIQWNTNILTLQKLHAKEVCKRVLLVSSTRHYRNTINACNTSFSILLCLLINLDTHTHRYIHTQVYTYTNRHIDTHHCYYYYYYYYYYCHQQDFIHL